jgi:hypothetical protein
MKTLLAAFCCILLLQGCALLEMVGINHPSDVAPSLKHCHQVDYERRGVDVTIKAKCRIPVA